MQVTTQRWVWFWVVLLLAACQPVTTPAPSTVQRAELPPNIAANARLYRIVPEHSELLILVYRAGSLARLGHNHVISANSVTGNVWLADPLDKTTFQLQLPVNDMQVDDVELRAQLGSEFSSPVDADAIAGTYANMLSDQQLDGANWPEITLLCRAVSQADGQWLIDTDITTRGMTRQIKIPARVELAEDQLTVTGEFSVLQSELGLQPFSVMMGALQVRDQLDVRFRLVAQPSIAAASSRRSD